MTEILERAAQELGITSSEHVSDSTKMMLTKEQREYTDHCMEQIRDYVPEDRDIDDSKLLDLLGAMLSQSRPAWEITEERIAFLSAIKDLMEENGFVAKAAFLKAMLEEAK